MTTINFYDDAGDAIPVLVVDNGDGTYSISVDASLEVGNVTIGEVDQGGAGSEDWKVTLDNELVTISGVASILPGTYLGQQVIAGNDGNQNATLPIGTKAIWIMAEGGAVGATVNGTSASLAAAGYHVPENNIRLVGPFNNITSIGVFAATGDNAHLVYES